MGQLDALLKVILAEGRRMLGAREIHLLLRENNHLILRGSLGLQHDSATPLAILQGGGLEWRAIESGRPVFSFDAEAEPGYQPIPGWRSRAGALLAVPIRLRDQVIGVVAASRPEPGWFTESEARWLTILAQIAAVAIENERLRAAEQEQATLKAREEFLAVVSHELKTPVAVIKAYVEVLLRRAEEHAGAEAELDILRSVHDQADRMLAMIEELLDFQRLGGGQFTLELSRFDLNALAKRTVESLQLTARSHSIVFVGGRGSVPILADRKRIEEVLINLIENAVKYSPPASEITVSVHLNGKEQPQVQPSGSTEVVLVVADQGVGVAPEVQSQIFERFFQANRTPVRGHVGLGLGLYISREIVARHGGRMWVDSVPGQGSRFYVALPLAPEVDER